MEFLEPIPDQYKRDLDQVKRKEPDRHWPSSGWLQVRQPGRRVASLHARFLGSPAAKLYQVPQRHESTGRFCTPLGTQNRHI